MGAESPLLPGGPRAARPGSGRVSDFSRLRQRRVLLYSVMFHLWRIARCRCGSWWALTGLLALTAPAAARDTLTIRTNYYAVSGATAAELRASMNSLRPWKSNGGMDAF